MNVFSEMLWITLAVLVLAVVIERLEIRGYESEVATYQAQINTLKLDSEKQAADTKLAYESAQEQVKQIQDKTQAILRTKVSSNCEESIKWLVKQARSL